MGCPDSNEIVDFVDGEPAPEARGRVHAHLAECTACRQLVAALAGGDRGDASRDGAVGTDEARLVAGTTIGRYVIQELAGRGGMGVVYRATDTELDRTVAIKLVRPGRTTPVEESRGRLAREARALARLSHPNVVAVYDVGTHDRGLYIAMEFVAGDTLRRWLADAPRTRDQILDVLVDAGRGLAAAHDAGLVHRDVKPDNICIGADGRARILDFGLVGSPAPPSEPGAATGDDTELTRTGAVLGTPAFMAPEQLAGRPVDARSDQFSFCATACEALGGERPVSGRSPSEIGRALDRGEIRVPAAVPPRLRRILERGLARDPDARHPSMHALLAALAAARRPPPWRRRAAIAAIALAGLGAGAAALAVPGEPPCRGAARELASVWDPVRAREVAALITASGHADPAGATARLTGALDGYATAWSAMRTEACRAARVDGVQTEAVLERRMRCLDRRLAGLRGLTTRLRPGLAPVQIDGALSAALALPPVAACADLDRLDRLTPPPADPERHAAFVALETRLAAAPALAYLGQFDEAIAEATAIADEAVRIGHPEVEAQARVVLGRTAIAAGELDRAEAALRAAAPIAARIGDDLTTAAAWVYRIEAETERGRYREALALVEAAEVAVLRAGDDPELGVQLDVLVADALSWLEDYARAVPRVERAVARAEAAFAPPHPSLGLALVSRGDILEEVGRADQAVADIQRGLEMMAAAYGPEHPALVFPVIALGAAHLAAGHRAEARAELERGVALARRFDGENPILISAHMRLGNLAAEEARSDDALASYRAAAEVAEAHGGPDHYRVTLALGATAQVLFDRGDLDGAEAAWSRALEIRRRVLPPEHPSIGWALYRLGKVARARGDRATAIARFEAALPVLVAADDTEQAALVRTALAELRAARR